MHRFILCAQNGGADPPDLQTAHLIGNDGVPVRGDVVWSGELIECRPRSQDPVGLSLLWTVPDVGSIQLQTTRLPARETPYHLHVELARHLLMRISVKREEWGLFDFAGMDDIASRIAEARNAFIAALQYANDPKQAAEHADRALAIGLEAAEQLSAFHANVFISRRQQLGGFTQPFIGVSAPCPIDAEQIKPLREAFDFARVPIVWRNVQPTEQELQLDHVEKVVQACNHCKLALRGGPLLTFGVRSVPDWMYLWENDFESIYDAARDYVKNIVRHFSKSISSWTVVSGIHADNVFGFSFEQVMELTRMAATITKQTAPRSQVILDLSQPWGEYYARNQRTIPPLLYADMAVQSGIPFDGFGLQLLFGIDADGYRVRDPLQVSALIDRLANLGKPLHVTALGAPSAAGESPRCHGATGGAWRVPWSEEAQATWLETLCEIALSKPYVETICLQPLVDGDDNVIAEGGLLRPDGTAKPALDRLIALRRRLLSEAPPE